jgi:hypothetical protein
VADSCEHSNEPSGSIKGGNFFTSWVTVSFSRRTLLHGSGWLVGWLVQSGFEYSNKGSDQTQNNHLSV